MGSPSSQRHTRKKRRQFSALCRWYAKGQTGGKPTPTHKSKSGRTGSVDKKQLLGGAGKGKAGKMARQDILYSFGSPSTDAERRKHRKATKLGIMGDLPEFGNSRLDRSRKDMPGEGE